MVPGHRRKMVLCSDTCYPVDEGIYIARGTGARSKTHAKARAKGGTDERHLYHSNPSSRVSPRIAQRTLIDSRQEETASILYTGTKCEHYLTILTSQLHDDITGQQIKDIKITSSERVWISPSRSAGLRKLSNQLPFTEARFR